MVTVTLKLGISILNGGNILVQQVSTGPHTCRIGRMNSNGALFTLFFCLDLENAGLPQGEKRCRLF